MLSTRGRWTVPGDVASMPAWWSRMERAGLTYGGAWAVPGPRHPGIEQRSAYTAADHEHLPGLLLSVCTRPLAPRVCTGHRRALGLHPPPSGQLTRLRFELVHPPPGRRQQRVSAAEIEHGLVTRQSRFRTPVEAGRQRALRPAARRRAPGGIFPD